MCTGESEGGGGNAGEVGELPIYEEMRAALFGGDADGLSERTKARVPKYYIHALFALFPVNVNGLNSKRAKRCPKEKKNCPCRRTGEN